MNAQYLNETNCAFLYRYTSCHNKILIEDLPHAINQEELMAAFDRAGGGVEFLHIFYPERFEAAQPCHASLLNKKIRIKAEMKQVIQSDTYAFVTFKSEESYRKLTTGDVRIFGICMKVICNLNI